MYTKAAGVSQFSMGRSIIFGRSNRRVFSRRYSCTPIVRWPFLAAIRLYFNGIVSWVANNVDAREPLPVNNIRATFFFMSRSCFHYLSSAGHANGQESILFL